MRLCFAFVFPLMVAIFDMLFLFDQMPRKKIPLPKVDLNTLSSFYTSMMFWIKSAFRLFFVGVMLLVLTILFFFFSVKVNPAEVAISVDLYGSDKGVELEVLGTGRNFYNAITHDVIKYPSYIQQGRYKDLKFQDVDGLTVSADVAIDYKFVEEQIPQLYTEYRKEAGYITEIYFPTWIKNAMIEQSSKLQVDEIYGSKKEDFRNSVLEQLRGEFEPKGIFIENLYFTNGIQIPAAVLGRIDQKIKATQIAQQKQNELAAVEADVAKTLAKEAGDAKARLIEATSKAEANRLLNQSLSENVLRFKELEVRSGVVKKWDGDLPDVVGNDGGFILDISK
jgi:regulator of protease activity HflC (stomatin/prohibitin superfamily)